MEVVQKLKVVEYWAIRKCSIKRNLCQHEISSFATSILNMTFFDVEFHHILNFVLVVTLIYQRLLFLFFLKFARFILLFLCLSCHKV